MSDEANLATARINLGYTDIVAPITGKVGRTNITKGNVVSPESGPLTVIVSQDPMYVTFPVSQRDFLREQAAGRQVDISNVKARLRFAGGRTYQQEGGIDFVDVQVDRNTDTILVRATFPNPASMLVDGQFVRIKVENGTPEDKVDSPGRAHRRPGRGLRVRGRGRQSHGQAGEAGQYDQYGRRDRAGALGRRAAHRGRSAACAPGN
jgi:membrane fusion protein, multidrug efflux system